MTQSLGMKKIALILILNPYFFCYKLYFILRRRETLPPLPKPNQFQEISLGTKIDLQDWQGASIYFHFTNPNCKCSFKAKPQANRLFKKFYDKIPIIVVIDTNQLEEAISSILTGKYYSKNFHIPKAVGCILPVYKKEIAG